MTNAWQQNIRPGNKLVLLALHKYANGGNKARVSIAQLTKDCNVNDQTMRNILHELREKGLIVAARHFCSCLARDMCQNLPGISAA